MSAVELVFIIGWVAFWTYWLGAAFSMKRGHIPWSRELRIRVVIAVVVVLLIRFGALGDSGLTSNPWRKGVGLALFALGLGFAVWARVHIGRNWGTPMSQKDEPELVTSGPYGLVRHPIYSGILVAGRGSRHGSSAELVLADRNAPCRNLLWLRRHRRRALPESRIRWDLPGVPAFDEEAHPLHLLNCGRTTLSPPLCCHRSLEAGLPL